MFSYEPLLITLVKKKKSLTQLREGIKAGRNTIAKINKGENISMDTLNDICNFLDCKIEDVIEHIKVE